jgi:hypothetical protein
MPTVVRGQWLTWAVRALLYWGSWQGWLTWIDDDFWPQPPYIHTVIICTNPAARVRDVSEILETIIQHFSLTKQGVSDKTCLGHRSKELAVQLHTCNTSFAIADSPFHQESFFRSNNWTPSVHLNIQRRGKAVGLS